MKLISVPASDAGEADPRADVLPVLRFGIRGLPLDEGVERWRDQLSGYSDNDPLEPEPTDFHVEMTTWHFGTMLATDARIGAQRHACPTRKIRPKQVDHYKLILQVEGDLLLDADGARVVVRPGQLAMTDMARPHAYDAERGRRIVLFVARDALEEALPAPLDLHCRMPRGIVADMLASHLLDLVDRCPELPASSGTDIASATLQLVAAAMTLDVPRRPAEAAQTLESTLLRQICRHIDLHLGEAALSAGSLCATFNVSRATLYRLFEPLAGISRYVQERRLVRVHEQIAAANGRVHLGSLAETYGFRSASHFSQAFRRRFGHNPSEAPDNGSAVVASEARASRPLRLCDWVLSLRS